MSRRGGEIGTHNALRILLLAESDGLKQQQATVVGCPLLTTTLTLAAQFVVEVIIVHKSTV